MIFLVKCSTGQRYTSADFFDIIGIFFLNTDVILNQYQYDLSESESVYPIYLQHSSGGLVL